MGARIPKLQNIMKWKAVSFREKTWVVDITSTVAPEARVTRITPPAYAKYPVCVQPL